MSELMRYAMGWLDYSYEQFLNTPVEVTQIALDAKIEFIQKTNPLGGEAEVSPKRYNL